MDPLITSEPLLSQSFKLSGLNRFILLVSLCICRGPMYSVYDPSFGWMGLPVDPHLRLCSPTLGGPTSVGPSSRPSLGNATKGILIILNCHNPAALGYHCRVSDSKFVPTNKYK